MKLFIILCILTVQVWAVPALVSHVSCHDNGAGSCLTVPINDTGATLIVAGVTSFTGFPQTFSDSNGNTYKQLTTYGNTGTPNTPLTTLYYSVSPTVSVSDIYSCTGKFLACFVASWSGTLTNTFVFDFEIGNFNSANVLVLSPGSITPSTTHEIYFTVWVSNTPVPTSSLTIDSGFTILDHEPSAAGNNEGASAYFITTTGVTPIAPTWTMTGTASTCASSMASFRSLNVPAHKPGSGTGIW